MRPGNFNYWYPGPGHFNRYPPIFMYGARYRFFPRLLWFALGAGAYAFWSAKREESRFISGGGGGHNGEWKHWSSNHYGCHRRRDQPPAEHQHQQPYLNATPVPTQYPQHHTVVPTVAASPAAAPAYQQTAPNSPADSHSPEWHTERVREVTKQASDTVAEISEHALDSLMANLQALKAKITEARETREKERAYLEQRAPTDKPNQRDASPPERLV